MIVPLVSICLLVSLSGFWICEVKNYPDYPGVSTEHPELDGDELKIAGQFKLIEKIQIDHFGQMLNDAILKPTYLDLMFNWIGGGVAQYQQGANVISCTFALSLPGDDPHIDDSGVEWSGLGMEYFFEGDQGYEWQTHVLIHVASQVYKDGGFLLREGMFISPESGFIPPANNPDRLGLLAVKDFCVKTPGGRVDYIKLVPLSPKELEAYKQLGDKKREMATAWFKKKKLPGVFVTPGAKVQEFDRRLPSEERQDGKR